MLYNFKRKKVCRHLLAGGAVCLAGLALFSCSDTYDLDEEQPSGLNSIYGYMKDKGNYKNFLRLIDDLGQSEVLSRTGSKTVFIADDDAFAEFFKTNEWGVSSYDGLSLSQKTLLLNSAMIDNPYSTSMLSTAQTPVKGKVCRRSSSNTPYDSVEVVSVFSDEIPQFNDRWTVLQNVPSRNNEIVLFKDNNPAPMIHFTPQFVTTAQMESTDVDFLYNDPDGTRQSDDTYVNNAKIRHSQFCTNGFVHEVDRVITPLDNMAEIIRKQSDLSIFSRILERFSAPAFDNTLTQAYNINTGESVADVDSVFIKRYFSKRSAGSSATQSVAFDKDKDEQPFEGELSFDPGWNTYVTEGTGERQPMMEDMAVMIVPSNAALEDWWNNKGGAVIKDQFGSWDNTPSKVLDDLINVGMLNSLTQSVPSRFATVLDKNSNTPLGITRDKVDRVLLGCNGAVYVTNEVLAPTTYSSVLFPTVINTDNMSIINDVIENREYGAYLNSMVSTYSFFIPTNQGLMTYIDPVSFAQEKTKMWKFHYDGSKTIGNRVWASVFECSWDGTQWVQGDSIREIRQSIASTVDAAATNQTLANRLEDMLDNIIGLEQVRAGKTYYMTKGKNYVKVGGTVNQAGSMTASGTLQAIQDTPLRVDEVYHMTNGESYVTNGVLMGTSQSTADILAGHEDFSEFFNILIASGAVATSEGGTNPNHSSVSKLGNLVSVSKNVSGVDQTFSMLNAHHYTVFAPTNEAMYAAYAQGMKSMEDLAAAEAYDEEQDLLHEDDASWVKSDSADHVREIMRDFVKYHIQSNSIYLDEGFDSNTVNETVKTRLEYMIDDETGEIAKWTDNNGKEYFTVIAGSPYRITLQSVSPTGMTIRDVMGNDVHVVTSGGLYNLMGREYWLDNINPESATVILNSSSVVVHAVDRVLRYSADQFGYVPKHIESGENVKRRK